MKLPFLFDLFVFILYTLICHSFLSPSILVLLASLDILDGLKCSGNFNEQLRDACIFRVGYLALVYPHLLYT